MKSIIVTAFFCAVITSQVYADTLIYDNSYYTGSGLIFGPGLNTEIFDYGSNTGGNVSQFRFRYYNIAGPTDTTKVRFYRNVDIPGYDPGDLIKEIIINDILATEPSSVWYTHVLSADERFDLPSGTFGYSFECSSSAMNIGIASGGAGQANELWKSISGGDWEKLWWGPSYWAGICMQIYSPPWEGAGTADSPYLIYDADDMQAIGSDPNHWDAHFKLMADIDLSAYTGTEFNVIGYYVDSFDNNPFTGVFDGNGHNIAHFSYITGSGTDHIGLFGYVSGQAAVIENLNLNYVNIDLGGGGTVGSLAGRISMGTIRNCSVMDVDVSGSMVGGLVGYAYKATISECFAQGDIEGGGDAGGLIGRVYQGEVLNSSSNVFVEGTTYVGGLVGQNGYYADDGGIISACFSSGSVDGGSFDSIGGLVGITNNGTITNCYSESSVLGTINSDRGGLVGTINTRGSIIHCYSVGSVAGYANGLVGEIYNSGQGTHYAIISCYWDTETSGQTFSSGGGMGKTTEQMKQADTYAGWGVCEEVWKIDEGIDYPRLVWQDTPGALLRDDVFTGTGSLDEPFLIYTAQELNLVGQIPCLWDKHFKLMDDINLSSYNGSMFNRIGIDYTWAFTGTFDGSGYMVSNFTYQSDEQNFIGLFGYVSNPNATIKNFHLYNPDLECDFGHDVGTLIGKLESGTVDLCSSSSGSIFGHRNRYGGLVGTNSDGTINRCRAQGIIDGNRDTGGLCGFNYGNITKSFSIGSVSADDFFEGGLVGSNTGVVRDCYSKSNMYGSPFLGSGGLVGKNSGTVSNSFATGHVSGTNEVGGLIGSGNSGSVENSFWNIDTGGPDNGFGVPMDDPNMMIQSNFENWDFFGETDNGTEDIWMILEGINHPEFTWQNPPALNLAIDNTWMYQNLPGQTRSKITADVVITDDPLSNSSYTYEWEFDLPDDVSIAPTITAGGEATDPCCTFAAPSCNEPNGISDSGQAFTVRVTVTGADFGNSATAEAQFGIALLGDVNNDKIVNLIDRIIMNVYWRTGSAGGFTFRDCNINCDGLVNLIDRIIANEIWRGKLGSASVTTPCPFR